MASTRSTGQPAPIPLSVTPGGARRELRALMDGAGWSGDADSVVLAVHEALTNAACHGGGVAWAHASVAGDAIEVVVCDRGPGFELPAPRDVESVPANPLAEDGRGLWLIGHIASRAEVGWDGADFCLRLWFTSA